MRSVQHNGKGLVPEQLQRCSTVSITPTNRAAAKRAAPEGLAIVKAIVEAHGGQVEAQSEGLGRGSTFSALLQRGKWV